MLNIYSFNCSPESILLFRFLIFNELQKELCSKIGDQVYQRVYYNVFFEYYVILLHGIMQILYTIIQTNSLDYLNSVGMFMKYNNLLIIWAGMVRKTGKFFYLLTSCTYSEGFFPYCFLKHRVK